MKKLPELYKNEDINTSTNKSYCYLKNEELKRKEIEEKLRIIFNGMGYAYNIPVLIKTKDKEYRTSLVTKTKEKIITLNNDLININDIISFEIL